MMNSARESQDWDNVVRCADDLLNSGFTLNSQLEQDALLSKAIANKNLDNTYAAKTDLAALATNTQSEAGAQAAYELAQLYYDEDNLEQAEATLNNLIDSATPHFYWLAKGFILLCDIYNDKGKTQEAIETLRSLKEKYPGHEGEIFNEIDTRLSKWTKRSR